MRFGIGFWSPQTPPPPPLGATFTLTQIQGAFPYNFTDGKTWHLGGYGVDSDYYDLALLIQASAIVGSWSNLTITLNNVVWTGTPTGLELEIRHRYGGSSDYTSTDPLITSTTMTFGATSVSITLTGTDLQNYFNGTTSNHLYLEWSPMYFAYYNGFDSVTFSVT